VQIFWNDPHSLKRMCLIYLNVRLPCIWDYTPSQFPVFRKICILKMCMHNYKLTPIIRWWIEEYVSYVLVNMVYCYTVAESVVTFPNTCISLALSCLETVLAVIFQVCSVLLSLYPHMLQRDSSGRFRASVSECGGWSSTCIRFWPKVIVPKLLSDIALLWYKI
jgi:hypothetical protein